MHWLAVHGAGVLFDFGGWVLIAFIYSVLLADLGAGDLQKIRAVLANRDFGDLNVEQIGDVFFHHL